MAKLTRKDWLDHGLASLESQGFTSLKADLLAKSLSVSRGSFYHHFTDLAAYHEAVLDHWLQVSSVAVVAALEAQGLDPKAKMQALISLVAGGASQLEWAVRAWAFTDTNVATTVAEVDRARLLYIAQVLAEMDLDDETARRRALILYLTNVGYTFLSGIMSPADEAQALEDVLALAMH